MGSVVRLPDRGAALTRQEREFLPAALEILETPPSPTARRTAWALTALVGAAVAWSYFSEVDIVASASGKLFPVGQVKLVQPYETSVVRGIRVAEGEHVRAGQVLIDLDPTEPAADIETARTERAQALLDAEAARVVLADDDAAAFAAPPEIEPALVEATRTQVRLQLAAHRAGLEGLRDQIAQKRAALAVNGVDAAKNTELLPLAVDKYETQRGLFGKGLTAKPNLLQAQTELIDKKAERLSIPEQRRQLEAEIGALEQKIAESHAQLLRGAAEQRIKALQKAAVADQTLRKARRREGLKQLPAPVDGTVHELKANTLGGVVTTADALMTIVPDDATLEVEALVDHREMGFLREGQRAEIKLEAFPFTRHGTVPGTVRFVARNASEPKGDKGPQTPGGYRVLIALERATMPVDGAEVRLMPGMAAQADVKTGSRRVISFLLDPVVRHASEAGRER